MKKNNENDKDKDTSFPIPNDEKLDCDPMDILEEALVLCKFGKFHVLLLFASFCAILASVMVTTTSSYILPIAECDLDMTILGKGILTAMPFFGQVGAALLTGFITDAFGRKMFLVGGNIGMFICTILEGSSQNYWVLIFGKCMEGIFLSLCFTASLVMVPEFTHKNVRDRVLIFSASFMSMSLIVVALISWGMLPQNWNFVIWDGYFELHSWNIYLYACSIWGLLASILYYYLPESPKFLLSHGYEREALEVLQQVYSINTGKSKESFPITSLLPASATKTKEKMRHNTSFKKQLTEAMFEVKNLFRQPLLTRLLLFLFMNFVCLFSYTSLRLWYPQISTIIESYQNKNGDSARFCIMIDDYTQALKPNSTVDSADSDICIPHISGFETYLNGIIMGLVSLTCFAVTGYLVKFLGQKPLICGLLILCGSSSGALYWTNSLIQIAILMSTTCAFMQNSMSLLYNLQMRVFPTTLRSLSFSMSTLLGRIGSLLGSMLFPLMLEWSCMAPFLTLLIISFCVAVLVYFLPNPSKENNGAGDR